MVLTIHPFLCYFCIVFLYLFFIAFSIGLFILVIQISFSAIGSTNIVNILHLFPPITSVNIWSPTTAICSGFSLSFSCTFLKPNFNGFLAKYSYSIPNSSATFFTFCFLFEFDNMYNFTPCPSNSLAHFIVSLGKFLS